MPNVISVVTAAHEPVAEYLPDTYASLSEQRLPNGWAWEWLVQEDGETGRIAAVLPADTRIRAAMSRARGPAVARTMALTRATGVLIKNLDADDVMRPGALARDIDALTRLPEIGWTTSRVLDLLPDGSLTSWVHEDPDEGILPRGSIGHYYRTHDWQLPVHPMTICIRRGLVTALGGWMALTSAEDTGLLIAADAIADGYFIHEPSVLYRQHISQETVQPYHTDPAERAARAMLIVARADILRTMFDPHRSRVS